ncbi:MAG: TolC family protein [Gemmatimonadales bacterium]
MAPDSPRRAPRAAALLLALLCLPNPLGAQQKLTLQDAIALARKQSHQALAARDARDASRHRTGAFNARLLPQLSLSGTVPAYNRSIIQVVQPDGTTLFRPQQQTNAALTATLSQKLPFTGGDLFVSSSLSRLTVSGQQSVETWSSTPVRFGLRQDIFRPNTLSWDRKEQSIDSELRERLYLEAMEDVAIQTTQAFFDMYTARTAFDNAVTNAAVNDTLYTLNKGRYEVGKIGENDLLQSELALLRARTSVEQARLQYERTTAALRLALNLPPATPLEIEVGSDVPDVRPDTAVAVTQAMRNRSVVTDVELQDVQARRAVTQARLAQGIGATVQASFGFNATAPEASQAYQNLLEARQFTLSVEVPLWQWGAHGNDVSAARLDQERVSTLSEETLQQTQHEAHFAALELTQAYRNLALVAKADTVAGKRFEVAYNRYVIGRISIDNLYIAQSEKDAALTQFVQGLRSYWLAYYRLRRATLYDFEAGQPIGS